MKMHHVEYVRLILLSSSLITNLLTRDSGLFGEVNNLLTQNNIPIDDISRYLEMADTLSFLTAPQFEQLTKDYSRIESLYNTVVYNLADLITELGIQDDPIKIFALYVYLYRSGYLSYNKDFKYSTNMKDLPKLGGVDVVRGRGVCRSISSMFTDVCQALDIDATNVAVKATEKSMNKKERLSPVNLITEPKGKKFAKLVGKATSILPIGNHQLTHIKSDKVTGIFDPTNDIFMNIKTGRKYSFINDETATMSHSLISNFASTLLNMADSEVLPITLQKQSKLPKINYEEYKEIYRDMLKMIQVNKELIEAFYNENKYFYEAINQRTEEQHSMIKRMFPILPIK